MADRYQSSYSIYQSNDLLDLEGEEEVGQPQINNPYQTSQYLNQLGNNDNNNTYELTEELSDFSSNTYRAQGSSYGQTEYLNHPGMESNYNSNHCYMQQTTTKPNVNTQYTSNIGIVETVSQKNNNVSISQPRGFSLQDLQSIGSFLDDPSKMNDPRYTHTAMGEDLILFLPSDELTTSPLPGGSQIKIGFSWQDSRAENKQERLCIYLRPLEDQTYFDNDPTVIPHVIHEYDSTLPPDRVNGECSVNIPKRPGFYEILLIESIHIMTGIGTTIHVDGRRKILARAAQLIESAGIIVKWRIVQEKRDLIVTAENVKNIPNFSYFVIKLVGPQTAKLQYEDCRLLHFLSVTSELRSNQKSTDSLIILRISKEVVRKEMGDTITAVLVTNEVRDCRLLAQSETIALK